MDKLKGVLGNMSAATADDLCVVAQVCGVKLPSSFITGHPLTGQFVLSFENAGDLLSAIDAEHEHYLEYLRLYAAVRYASRHRSLPATDVVSVPEAIDAVVTKRLHELRVTERMLIEMTPLAAFGPAIQVKNSVLKQIQDEVVRAQRGL
jgi:hypothetical protein